MDVMETALTETAPPDPAMHAFFLDFDGTLAAIASNPDAVRLEAATHDLLAKLSRQSGGAVAVISGRALADLATRLAPLDLALSGSHGLESRLPGGPLRLMGTNQAALERAHASLRLLARDQSLLLERKPGAVALHYRGKPALAVTCRAAVVEAARLSGLRAMHGTMVSEAVAPGIDKGLALRALMEEPPFAGRIPVMIGDDTTDEDGFAAAQALGGIGVRIGGSDSVARLRCDSREAALDWLARSLRAD